LQNGAILYREEALVARTFKPVVRLRIIDCAGKMSAFLTVAYVFVLGGADHDAVVIFCGIAEKLHSPNRNLSTLSHWLLWVDGSLVENGANQNPNVAHEHAKAGQD
jgi:hypothetical protein